MEKEKTHRKRILSPKVIKVVSLAIAVVAQIAVIVVLYIFFSGRFMPVNWVLKTLSIIAVLVILRSDSDPSYKIPWIVLIFVVPLLGGCMYLWYGRRHIGKKSEQRIIHVAKMCREALYTRKYYNNELIDDKICGQANYLMDFVDAPAYRNTTATYFPLGEDFLPVFIEELKKAEKFIFMEYFIIERGIMLDSVLNVLIEKAKEGVEVRFMYDSFGSILKAPGDLVKSLRKMGIQCYEFNTFRTVLDGRYNNRDHRKICVIDGNVGFTGGLNLADEYINKKKICGHWKDTAIMLKGEAVWSLTTMFLALWDVSFHKQDDFLKYKPTAKFNYMDGYFIPYTDYPNDDEAAGKNVYLNMIGKSDRYVYIMTPYLILDATMANALENAAKRGVDVRIITPGIPDKKFAYMLTQSYYEALIKAGVKIYEYEPGFVHAKIFMSDDESAIVGTINLDYRSLTHHYEDAVLIYKSGVLNDIMADFQNTLSKCREVSLRDCKKFSILKSLLLPILRLLSPLF